MLNLNKLGHRKFRILVSTLISKSFLSFITTLYNNDFEVCWLYRPLSNGLRLLKEFIKDSYQNSNFYLHIVPLILSLATFEEVFIANIAGKA